MSEVKISGDAVIRFLHSRNSEVNFIRDTLEVYVERDKVVVRIADKISNGSTTHYSEYNVSHFESVYGKANA